MKAAIGAALLFGIFLGHAFTGPEIKYKVVPKTVTETETITQEIYTVPDSCLTAIQISAKLSNRATKIDNSSSSLLHIMSEQRLALAEDDSNKTNLLETRLRKLQGRTVESVQIIGETQPSFYEAITECRSAVK